MSPLAPPTPFVEVIIDHERQALEDELAAAKSDNEALRKKLEIYEGERADAEIARREAVVEAEAVGRDQGRREGAENKGEGLALLERGLERALEEMRSDLAGLEILAVALAKAALAKVFVEGGETPDLMVRLIGRQMESLDRSSVLGIDVSSKDFESDEALQNLASVSRLRAVELRALDSLGQGDCKIRLRLGELEVGLGQQWGQLSGLLDDALALEHAA